MKAAEIYNRNMEQKAKEILKTDFQPLYDRLYSDIQFMAQKLGGSVKDFEQIRELINSGVNALKFEDLTDDIQKHYLSEAIKD